MQTSINVYVGTYGKYNAGSISGEWVDLSEYDNLKDFYKYCHELHQDEEDPEIMFQDIENGFGLIGESWINQEIYEIIEKIEDYNDGEDFIKSVLECASDRGEITLDNIEDVLDVYHGEYKDDEDFAYEMADSCGYINDKVSWPYTCIDWERAARDLMFDYVEYNGHYFHNC